jgi:hypothetical protein
MEPRYDSYCGLFCGACENLLVSEKGEVEKAAKEWNVEPEDINCFGCKSEKNAICCIDCDFKKCCESKNIDFCFQCKNFPCLKLIEFKNDKYPHHSIVLKNLASLNEKGLKEWLIIQKNRWSCSKCGIRFTWYDEQCKKCGGILYSCKEEEKDL